MNSHNLIQSNQKCSQIVEHIEANKIRISLTWKLKSSQQAPCHRQSEAKCNRVLYL